MPDPTPVWEQRAMAPRLHPFSLLGSPVSWSASGRYGVVLATTTGRVEVYAFDAATTPARLTQLSDRPTGTTGGAISLDGRTGYYFDDTSGNETGRWISVLIADPAQQTTLLPELSEATPAGFVPVVDGQVLIGRLVREGFELAVVRPDGSGRVAYISSDFHTVVGVSGDGSHALLSVFRNGDDEHPGTLLVRLSDGAVVAEHVPPGTKFEPADFDPLSSTRVLVTEESTGWNRPAIWDTKTGEQTAIPLDVDGDASATWFPDRSALLVTVLHQARHRLFRVEPDTGESTEINLPLGAVNRARAFSDGSVQVLGSRSNVPPTLLRVSNGHLEPLIELPGPTPPPTDAIAEDVFADGPGGEVHGLLYQPPGGTAPYPAVFVLHGGPTYVDLDAWTDAVLSYVDQGYAVVRVNYRGSTGYGAAWREALRRRVGFIELEDVTALRTALEDSGVIDPQRVAVTGGSWGGYLTLMALGTQPDKWRSGAALVPLADWFLATEDSPPWVVEADKIIMGGSITEIPDVYRETSPITYVDNVTAPLFIVAGENDPRCPVRQIDGYVAALRERQHPVTYIRTSTGHDLPNITAWVDELRNIVDFLKETL
jgi:dipeptidyl aminopeptidase/acylaminoacyl peptidase